MMRSVKSWMALSAVALSMVITSCATSPTGRKQLIVVPEAQMAQLGAQSFQQLKGQTPTESDPAINKYVQCVAAPIAEQAKDDTEVESWEVVVFKDDTANAFALPGGKIGVHTGLLKVAKTQGQLAAVIGHEVGHVIARHGAERVSQSLAAQGGLGVLDAALGGNSPNRAKLLAGLVQVGFLLPYGRTQESESDLIGIKLMAEAGFDPRESVTLWQNMQAAAGGGGPPEFLSTHPSSETRIAELTKQVPEATKVFTQAQAQGRRPQCSPPR